MRREAVRGANRRWIRRSALSSASPTAHLGRLNVDGRVSRPPARGLRKRVLALPTPAAQPAAVNRTAKAVLGAGGRTAVAPAGASRALRAAIAAANRIVGRPYRYGGGHRRWEDSGYDCSGTVSYVLHGAGLLDSPLDSTAFKR